MCSKKLGNRNFEVKNEDWEPVGDIWGSSGVPGVKTSRSDGPPWSHIGGKGEPVCSTFEPRG